MASYRMGITYFEMAVYYFIFSLPDMEGKKDIPRPANFVHFNPFFDNFWVLQLLLITKTTGLLTYETAFSKIWP